MVMWIDEKRTLPIRGQTIFSLHQLKAKPGSALSSRTEYGVPGQHRWILNGHIASS